LASILLETSLDLTVNGVLFVCTLDVGRNNNACFTVWLVMRHVQPYFDVGVIIFGSLESGVMRSHKLGKACFIRTLLTKHG
jgi:hypothetical protein